MGNCFSAISKHNSNNSQSDDTSEKEFHQQRLPLVQLGGISSADTHLNNAYRSNPKLNLQTSFSGGNATHHQLKQCHSQQILLNEVRSANSPRTEMKTEPTKLVAIFPYESRSEGDLGFQKGDCMYLLDSSNSDWWYVRNAKEQQGYVPRDFVAFCKTPQAHEWFAGRISRSIAERMVAERHLPPGTFLIRERELPDQLEYALTIRDMDHAHGPCVKHYKIRTLDNERGYYIASRVMFTTLEALVNYYSERADGLCHSLTNPAPRMAPTRPDLSHETQHNWEIPRHELELVRQLGDGNFGEVWYGRWRGKVEVAIKTMKSGTMTSVAFISEANIMKQCQHPNLVRLFAVCTTEEPFYIITEYMPSGSLLHYLREEERDERGRAISGQPRNPLSMQALVDICAQIANGMKYLEDRKLVHRDLAARNVLVGEKISGVPVVKVADFGLARKLMEEGIYEAQEGGKFPIKWTAPEAAIQGSFTVKSDIWSYGVLLYEIFTQGANPYPGMNNKEVVEQVDNGFRLSCPKVKDPDRQDLINRIYEQVMLKCWDRNADARPTFETLYHYFDDFFVCQQPNYIPP